MKQLLIGTPVGRALLFCRDALDLLKATVVGREAIGTIANDQLALHLITRICQDSKTFLDVGAHIGSVSAEVMRRKSVNCIAVEAMPDKAAFLRRKFARLQVVECAAGDRDGEVAFFVNLKASGYSSLGRPAENGEDKAFREIRVRMSRLDILIDRTDIDAMKIDVEGAELGVLRGGQKILSSCRPTIMFESGPGESLGYTKRDLWKLLNQHDYSIHIPNRLAHEDSGLGEEGFYESHLYPRRTTNYFAVARERRTEIRNRARQILAI